MSNETPMGQHIGSVIATKNNIIRDLKRDIIGKNERIVNIKSLLAVSFACNILATCLFAYHVITQH